MIPSPNVTTNNTIIVANNRAASPVVIDAQNNATYMGPNATTLRLEMNRIFTRVVYGQKVRLLQVYHPITSFSVKFANRGTCECI